MVKAKVLQGFKSASPAEAISTDKVTVSEDSPCLSSLMEITTLSLVASPAEIIARQTVLTASSKIPRSFPAILKSRRIFTDSPSMMAARLKYEIGEIPKPPVVF